jgi:hypothetical protein
MIVDGTTITFTYTSVIPSTGSPAYLGFVSGHPANSLIVNLYGSNTPANPSIFNIVPANGTNAGNTNPIMGYTPPGTTALRTYTCSAGSVNYSMIGGKHSMNFTNITFANISNASETHVVSANVIQP